MKLWTNTLYTTWQRNVNQVCKCAHNSNMCACVPTLTLHSPQKLWSALHFILRTCCGVNTEQISLSQLFDMRICRTFTWANCNVMWLQLNCSHRYQNGTMVASASGCYIWHLTNWTPSARQLLNTRLWLHSGVHTRMNKGRYSRESKILCA